MKFVKVLVCFAILACVCNAAFADLILDLRAYQFSTNGGTSYATVPTANWHNFALTSPGEIVRFRVYGTITDVPDTGGSQIYSLDQIGGTVSSVASGAQRGNMSGVGYNATDGYTGSVAVPVPNAQGDMTLENTDLSKAFWTSNGSLKAPSAQSAEFVGSFLYTLSSTGVGSAQIKFNPYTANYTGNSGNPITSWSSSEDWNDVANFPITTYSVPKGSVVTSSAAVCTITSNVVPEPATLVLLGMGALALVFIRRRK